MNEREAAQERPEPEGEDQEAVALLQANERLHQERVIFDRQIEKDRQWNRVQIASACVVVVLLPAVAVLSSIVVFNAGAFPAVVVAGASGALFADVLALIAAAYKVLIPVRRPSEGLAPVTADPREPRAPAAEAASAIPEAAAAAEAEEPSRAG